MNLNALPIPTPVREYDKKQNRSEHLPPVSWWLTVSTVQVVPGSVHDQPVHVQLGCQPAVRCDAGVDHRQPAELRPAHHGRLRQLPPAAGLSGDGGDIQASQESPGFLVRWRGLSQAGLSMTAGTCHLWHDISDADMMTLKSVCHAGQVSNICLILQEVCQRCHRQGTRPESQPRRDGQLSETGRPHSRRPSQDLPQGALPSSHDLPAIRQYPALCWYIQTSSRPRQFNTIVLQTFHERAASTIVKILSSRSCQTRTTSSSNIWWSFYVSSLTGLQLKQV